MKNKQNSKPIVLNKKFWWPFIGSAIFIIPSCWFFYGEGIFKIVFSCYLLIATVFFLADYVKRKKIGTLIFMLFCLFDALTFLATLYLNKIFTSILALITLILFVFLIYMFSNREKYW